MPSQHLFSANFWRTYWIAIRRSLKDPRDRKAAFRITIGLLVVGGYYGTFLWKAREGIRIWLDAPTVTLLLFAVITIGAVLTVRWYSDRQEKIAAELEAQAQSNPNIRKHIARDGLRLAVLLNRAGSESQLKEKVLPEGIEVTTRRVLLDNFREHLDWNTLPPQAQTLLLAADGHWTPQQIDSLRPAFETLRCIRWVLCFDAELLPLEAVPKLDYQIAQQITNHPEKFLNSNQLLPIWDVRAERNRADIFFSRCYAEAIQRNILQVPDEPSRQWAATLHQTMTAPDNRDLLAGVKTIAELDPPTLMYLFSTSFRRFQTLQLLMDLIDGQDRWTDWQTFCFPTLPDETPAPNETTASI